MCSHSCENLFLLVSFGDFVLPPFDPLYVCPFLFFPACQSIKACHILQSNVTNLKHFPIDFYFCWKGFSYGNIYLIHGSKECILVVILEADGGHMHHRSASLYQISSRFLQIFHQVFTWIRKHTCMCISDKYVVCQSLDNVNLISLMLSIIIKLGAMGSSEPVWLGWIISAFSS